MIVEIAYLRYVCLKGGEKGSQEIVVKIKENRRCQTIFDFGLLCLQFWIILDFSCITMKRNTKDKIRANEM